MRYIKSIITTCLVILGVYIGVIVVDIFVFNKGVGITQRSVNFFRDIQKKKAIDRWEDYKRILSDNFDYFNSSLVTDSAWSLSLPRFFPHNIQIISISIGNNSKDFIGKDGYIIKYSPYNEINNGDVVVGIPGVVVWVIGNNWYIIAPCNRSICSGEKLE